MSEQIQPGTPVRVVIEGRIAATRRHSTPFTVRTEAGSTFDVLDGLDPAVTVTPLDPERPTLEQVLETHAWDRYDGDCDCGEVHYNWHRHAAHLAEQLRDAGVAL